VAVAQHPAKVFQPLAGRFATALALLRANWQVAGVMLLFASAAFVVPTLTPVATTDDWGYTRSVEILVDEGRLTVLPAVAATAVFQIAWGALFATIFGMTLGVMRVATLVMVALGGLAFYGLLRELGIGRSRSALGVAVYLFNPLAFILAYTFMTDPYFTSLLIIATYFYVRGLRPERQNNRALIAASAVAACAFLTRQQGVLIPLAVLTYLPFSGRLRWDRKSALLIVKITAIPVVAIVGYYLWLRFVNGVPDIQTAFYDDARRRGWSGAWELVRHLSLIECMYLGFFVLPLAVSVVPGLKSAVLGARTPGKIAFGVWTAMFAAGLTSVWIAGKRMPLSPQFVGAGGLGPPDVRGSRPRLVDIDSQFLAWATVICAAGAVIIFLLLCTSLRKDRPASFGAGLVLAVALWQVVGVIPPSFQYINRNYSLDRYLLPLLPFGICLVLWASRDLRLVQPVGWAMVTVLALFSIAGTRDYLVFMDAVWDTAHDANAAGVANVRLDAGAAWDGYHLYTYGLDQDIKRSRTRRGPWWTSFYGKPTDSTYIVATKWVNGFHIVWKRPYSSWLDRDPTLVYLQRRNGTKGPP
jgi:4-amino-4-deoxy-L-arabinose transferase-like glycosyltransferase